MSNPVALLEIELSLSEEQIIEFSKDYNLDFDKAKLGLSEFIYYNMNNINERGDIMREVINIINQLQNTSGKNDKISIIKANVNNDNFTKTLYYTYADHLQYGFSEIKLRELLEQDIDKESYWYNGFDMLDELSQSNINDDLRNKVIRFLQAKDLEEQELWIKILTKDLRCNISEKSCNKAIKGLMPTHEVQQAYSIDKVKLKPNEWIALSLKLNGIRSTRIGDVFKSRQNKVMNGLNHIMNDIQKLEEYLNIKDYVFDGEMINNNTTGLPDNENFRLTTSIVNSDTADKSNIQLVIFDVLPKDEFIKGESELTFKDRLEILNKIDETIYKLDLQGVTVAPTYYTGSNHNMIDSLLEQVDKDGYEGLMLLRDVPYKAKRHSGIAKVKKFYTCDLEVIGYEEGTGRLKGMLGSFIVDFKGNKVNVGSGYDDTQRLEYWNNRDAYIGRVIEVKYKEESKNKKDNSISLQFPTFVRLREVGKEVSYN